MGDMIFLICIIVYISIVIWLLFIKDFKNFIKKEKPSSRIGQIGQEEEREKEE